MTTPMPMPAPEPMTPEQYDELYMSRCKQTVEAAALDDEYQLRCINGEKVFFVEYHKALMPGHIYSRLGRKEFGISGCCEFHFDEMAKQSEEWDNYDPEEENDDE
jgi:hypothetical protein